MIRAGEAWLLLRSLPKTLRFNLAYLPFTQALFLPIVVCHRVHFDRLGGTVRVPARCRPGTIRLGFGEVGIFDRERRRSVWHVEGDVVFQGRACLGHGTSISVDSGGVLTFGDGLLITAESAIVCRKAITFGNDVLVSWDVQVMDTDWHSVTDLEGTVLNPDSEILVGNHVWIGSRVLLMKGVRISRDSIVAAGSVVTCGTYHANVILAGVPAREIRQGITWRAEPVRPTPG
jgi:acetyltransferase-like isoleucine patch superfamily enzyme